MFCKTAVFNYTIIMLWKLRESETVSNVLTG